MRKAIDNKENLHEGHRERMREKFLSADSAGISDSALAEHELLEILLFFAQPRINTNETAHRLLARFGTLSGVLSATEHDLKMVPGVGGKTVFLLRLISTIVRFCVRREDIRRTNTLFSTPEDVVAYLHRLFFMNYNKEQAIMLLFDADGRHIRDIIIADGTSRRAAVDINRCVTAAVSYHCDSVVFAHNHTGSSTLPSEADLLLTDRLQRAFSAVNIEVSDHYIVTPAAYRSLISNTTIPTPDMQSPINRKIE